MSRATLGHNALPGKPLGTLLLAQKTPLAMKLEPILTELAQQRLSEAGKVGVEIREGRVGSNEHTLSSEQGQARDHAAEEVGISPITYCRAGSLRYRLLGEEVRAEAKERQRVHGGTAPGRKKNTSGKLPGVKGDSRDVVARYAGVSEGTIRRLRPWLMMAVLSA